ncbi:uncharacterized protein LOC118736042 [Rhagoletis pomonella]|uniref:uncharacterized protein LOC118736042 n=1 Tax=Rhagoletis pomonella TaxID=28610 RepID=UPI00177F9FFD|nr:uncharacterized protein LOC118736042 [Rhagoletis pomonella]
MYLTYKFLGFVWLFFLLIRGNEDSRKPIENSESKEVGANNSLLTASVYAKLFAERRREHQLMIRSMLASENYEKNFKLLQIAYRKIFEVITEKNATLTSNGYNASREGFPQSSELQDAVTFTLENCCIAAESLLHFPEISRRIFGKNISLWKSTLTWCNEFVNSLTHLVDETTITLMDLLLQEINEDRRTSNYVNPYYEASGKQAPKKLKKQYKKLKKGPYLGGRRTEL